MSNKFIELLELEITRTKSVSGEVLPHDIHQR